MFAHLGEAEIPFAFEGALNGIDEEIVESFKQKCENIGKKLLISIGKTPEKAAERALGYGNRAMLLVSRYNVPTQVLTCIWQGGDIGDFQWQRLLTRRSKK